MRFIGSFGLAARAPRVRVLALLSLLGLLSGCPKKEAEATPEPAAAPSPTNDKAGAEPPAAAPPAAATPPAAAPATPPAAAAPAAAAPAPKKKKDEGGW